MTHVMPLYPTSRSHAPPKTPEAVSGDPGRSAPATAAPLPGAATTERLADLFAPSLTLVLHLREVREFGDAEVLRARATRLLDEACRAGARAGWAEADLRAATFAAVAFLDETVQASAWSQKEDWLARPLQLELFGRYDAGEEFFVRLEGLREAAASKAAVIELYYLCLALGFRGRYQFGDERKHGRLVEDLSAEQRLAPDRGEAVLAPHAYPSEGRAAEAASGPPAWVVAVVAVLLGALAYAGMSLYASRVAGDARSAIEAVEIPTPDLGA